MPSKEKTISFRPVAGLRERLEAWAAERRVALNAAVNLLLEDGLARGSEGPKNREVPAVLTSTPRGAGSRAVVAESDSAAVRRGLETARKKEVLRAAEASAAHLGRPASPTQSVQAPLNTASVQIGRTKPALGSMLKGPKGGKK